MSRKSVALGKITKGISHDDRKDKKSDSVSRKESIGKARARLVQQGCWGIFSNP